MSIKDPTTTTNEKGYVMVLVMVIMLLLFVIGRSAITTSTIEVQIAGNDKTYKKNLYLAEAAAYQAAQIIEDETSTNLQTNTTPGLVLESDLPDSGDMTATANWTPYSRTVDVPLGGDALRYNYMLVNRGVATGGSLKMTTSQVYRYGIYGRAESTDSITRTTSATYIGLGYKRRH